MVIAGGARTRPGALQSHAQQRGAPPAPAAPAAAAAAEPAPRMADGHPDSVRRLVDRRRRRRGARHSGRGAGAVARAGARRRRPSPSLYNPAAAATPQEARRQGRPDAECIPTALGTLNVSMLRRRRRRADRRHAEVRRDADRDVPRVSDRSRLTAPHREEVPPVLSRRLGGPLGR